ncbi:Dual specificity phosphatase, catalytic domain [Friedmanniella luteola]|uniref:Dual specificity phosphatase, catalytic domain n=1 Tax=Friedmanniella luteola TaxID=546871 RepID=A0A1H1QE38_9ACTN|nr:dual specificity protein phosphatase [Friedmanniella luteola]SDS21685.1 Dual specificity phosphatase, catalytic domain [Friedmanniella luteola]
MTPDVTAYRIEGNLPAGYTPTGRFSVPLMSHVADGLWIGGFVAGAKLPEDFDLVISFHRQRQYVLGASTELVEMPAEDSLSQDPQVFRDAAALVAQRVAQGQKVLVHCHAGLNRSGLTAALALVELGHTAPAALQLLREKRSPYVLCNPAFKAALLLGDRAPEPKAPAAKRPDTAGDPSNADLLDFAFAVRQADAPLRESKTERAGQVDLWRLYWLHRGRLASPFVGALEPLPTHAQAGCSYDRMPGRGGTLAVHPDADIPALNCQCGWRGADNVEALAAAGEHMRTSPHAFLPIVNHIQDNFDSVDDFNDRRDALLAGGERHGYHILPVPALVRVTAHDAIRDDRISRRTAFLATPAGQRVTAHFRALGTAPAELFNGVPEGPGMWRARSLTITGPVITGPTEYALPNPRDLARHYGVKYVDVSASLKGANFSDALAIAAAGALPAVAMNPRSPHHHLTKNAARPGARPP